MGRIDSGTYMLHPITHSGKEVESPVPVCFYFGQPQNQPYWEVIDGIYAEVMEDDRRRNVAWLSVYGMNIYSATTPPSLSEFRDAVLARYPTAVFHTYRRGLERSIHREAFTRWDDPYA